MKTTINNWTWEIEDPGFLEYWFSDFEQYMSENTVKSNSERAVFTIDVEEKKYYVKYSHPTSLLQKTRSKINPKSSAEFNSAKLLEKSGIPTPKVVGWGKKGTESMLVTEEVPDTINAREYWFSIDYSNFQKRKIFLVKFAKFLKKFLDSGLYHPDFHLGNLLISEKNQDIAFTLIDPYGLTKENPLSKKKLFEMLCIIGALRGEINDQTGIEIIKGILPDMDEVTATQQWEEIILAESAKTIKLWDKRQHRILSDLRYSQILGNDDLQIRIRKNFAGNLCLNLDSPTDIIKQQDEYDFQEMSSEEAEKKMAVFFPERISPSTNEKTLGLDKRPCHSGLPHL